MSIFIPIPKKGNVKECSDYSTILLSSRTNKAIHKICQARLQWYLIQNFQMYKLDLEKMEEPEFKLTKSVGY